MFVRLIPLGGGKMNGFKERLEKAYELKEKVKILFNYPNSRKATVRRGIVRKINSNSFDLDEIKEGLVTYSYNHIVEIKGVPN